MEKFFRILQAVEPGSVQGGPLRFALAPVLFIALMAFSSLLMAQDSSRSGLEFLRRLGEDPSMTRIVPENPPANIPPYSEFKPVQPAGTIRKIRLAGREALLNPNIWIHPNPGTSQTEISIVTHPVNADVVFVGSNSILSGPNSVLFGSQGWYYTSDGGRTWMGSDTLPTHTSAGAFLADPAVNIDLDSNLFFGAIRFREEADVIIDRTSSPDAPWQQARIPEITEAEDKQHTIVDRSVISPFVNRLYTVYTDFDSSQSPYPLMFSRSTNRGVDFSKPVQISDSIGWFFAQGGNIATGPGGEVYVAWSGYDDWPPPVQTRIGFNRSTDGGSTWAGARSLRTINDIRGFLYKGKNVIRSNSFPSLAVDVSDGPRRGWIYLVYTERNPFVKVWMIRSTDGGETWSNPIKVGQERSLQINDQWFPWACVDPVTGALYVVYYDARNSDNNDLTDVIVSSSVDGGEQFEDVMVNDISFIPDPVPGTAYGYMGDYIGISALNGIVWPAWNDNRTGIHQAYTSRIEFQSISSPLKLVAVPETVDVGNLYLGFRDSARCGLRNMGITDTIVITALTSSNPAITAVYPTERIPPGKSVPVILDLDPEAIGPLSTILTVTSNDPDRPTLQVYVRGAVIYPPRIALMPDSVHAVLTTGDTVVRKITVSNLGSGEMKLFLSSSIIWMDATSNTTQIPPGDSAEITLTLKSGDLADGLYKSYVTMTSNDPSLPLLRLPVTLKINGIPRVQTEPAVLAIGDVAVAYGREVTLSIRNTGTFPLTASGFSIPHSALLISAPDTLIIPPHSAKPVRITFTPEAEESVFTYLRFDTNDPYNPEMGVSIRAFGYLPPEITVTPENFRVLTYRENNTSALISIFNTGIGTLHWSVSQDPPSAMPVAGEDALPEPSGTLAPWVTLFPSEGSIGPGRSGAIEMSIDARTLLFRSYLVEIVISSNDPDRPAVNVEVIVTVQRIPNVTLSPNVVTFTGSFIGYPDTARFAVRNTTVNTLIISDVTSDNPKYAFTDSLPFSVPPNSERFASVSYTPTGPSIETGQLLFTTSDRVSPLLSLILQGTGVDPPVLSVAPDTAAPPVLYSGDTLTKALTVMNSGSSTLNLSATVLPVERSRSGTAPSSSSIASQTVYLPYTIRDGWGYIWDIQKDGTILDGSDDAFDGGFSLDGFGTADVASVEERGREIAIGPVRVGTLLLTRKIFVSETSGFIRYLEIVDNDNVLPVNMNLLVYSNLGSDLESSLLRTSSGDTVLTRNDNWVITDDEPDVNDPAVAVVFSDETYHMRPAQVSASVGLGNISFAYVLSVPPQSRAIIMHFGAQRRNMEEAGAIAAALSALKEGALDGVSPEERKHIVNFGVDQICTVTPTSLILPAGAAAPLQILYNTSRLAGGSYHPVIQFVSNAPEARIVNYPLSLNVLDAPHLTGEPDTIRFPSSFVELEETVKVPLGNTGSLPLRISNVAFTHTQFRILLPLPLVIGAGVSDSLPIAFLPTAAGQVEGTMTISSDDPLRGSVAIPVRAAAEDRPVVILPEDTLSMITEVGTIPTARLVVRNAGAGSLRYQARAVVNGLEETEPGTAIWEIPDFRTRGNIYRVTTPTVLQEFRTYLDIQTPAPLDFVIYEATSVSGSYHFRFRSRDTIRTPGQGFVSSGPVGLMLNADRYYFMGVSFHGAGSSYYRVAPIIVPVSFGEIMSAGLCTPSNLPESVSVRRRTYTLFHQSVITSPSHCMPTFVPGSGVIGPGDSMTIGISLPFVLSEGSYRGEVQVTTERPARTFASLPIIAKFERARPPVPVEFQLSQNFPNPFNAGTAIRYSLATDSRVTLTVFNVLGQVVQKVIDDRVEGEGTHIVRWETNSGSIAYASGVYFYRLDATPLTSGGPAFTEYRKMILLK